LAQIAHESAGFATLVEYASGKAYEGRKDLGNTQPGDGVRYKGRGVIQLTGRANYRALGDYLGINLEAQPDLAAMPYVAYQVAAHYWLDRNINADADRDDLEAVTRAINGGTNGIKSRAALLAKAKAAFFLDIA
jgi:putative chitinase